MKQLMYDQFKLLNEQKKMENFLKDKELLLKEQELLLLRDNLCESNKLISDKLSSLNVILCGLMGIVSLPLKDNDASDAKAIMNTINSYLNELK